MSYDIPSGLNQFKVRGTNEAFEVDNDIRTCSYRLWQLHGYGCMHSIACVYFINRDVDNMFNTVSHMKSYNHIIGGMDGSIMWP